MIPFLHSHSMSLSCGPAHGYNIMHSGYSPTIITYPAACYFLANRTEWWSCSGLVEWMRLLRPQQMTLENFRDLTFGYIQKDFRELVK